MVLYDDFRVYNYALPADEIARISGLLSADASGVNYNKNLSLWPVPATDVVHVNYSALNNNSSSIMLNVFNMDGRLVLSKEMKYINEAELDVSNLSAGVYMLRLVNKEGVFARKLFVKR
ncbi:MAG: T9SS type A sorting domain-containing protein [Paludibacter sp.]